MDSSAAASPEVYMSVEEIADEIEYQKVLLRSLDDSVQDRDQLVSAITAEIRKLEKQLKASRQGQDNSMASTSGDMSHTYGDDPFGLAITNPVLNRNFGAASSTSSAPNSAGSAWVSNTFLSPPYPKLPTRKRSYAEHLEADRSDNKYRRTSPSPHKTRSTTPTSSGPEYPTAKDGFLDLTADDESIEEEIAKVRQRQMDAEAKANRERDDAEFARRLQQELSNGQISSDSFSELQSAPPGRTAFDRLLGRPPLGNFQANRERNPLSSASLANSSGPYFGPHMRSSNSVLNSQAHHTAQLPMPGSFQESDNSDSDIEIIPAGVFNASGRDSLLRGQNATKSHLPSINQIYTYGGVPNVLSGPQPQNGFLGTSKAAGLAALTPAAQLEQRYHAYMLEKQRQMLGGAGQAGYSSDNASARNGYSLPPPAGMVSRHTEYSVYPQQYGAFGSNMYSSSTSFGMVPNSAGPSGSRSILNHDPLSQILQSTGYNIGSMIDIHGNPLDTRMSQLDSGRLAEISDYVQNPRRTAQEIQDLLENIRPDVEIPKEDREGTPEGLKYALYEHQKLALTWLKQMEEGTNKGGILADDMGLGKTISALALILSRPSEDRRRKTTLIVGPVALVRQWEREIQTKIIRSHRLSTFLYHSGKKASWETLRTFDIVLTTYGTLGAEYKRQEEWRKKCDENPNLDRAAGKHRSVFLGDESLWFRVILDEAQCIKNKSTKAALAACHLRATTRFCLTGTPMMNGVHELFSLIRFLRIKPYNDYHKFTSEFGCLSKSGGSRGSLHHDMEPNAMKKLQAVLKAILLRRTKTSKIDGNPILTLPEKTEEVVHAIFNEDEQAYYTALETKTLIQFNKYVKAGTIGKNYQNILVLLLRLRQAACHPHLIMDFEEAPAEASIEDMETWAKTLLPDVIRRIVDAVVPFECPVCYDPIPNPRIVIPCGHDTCSECLVKIAGNVQQEAIAEGNEAGDAKCPTCRGKVDMKKIIDYETFKKVHMGEREDPVAEDNETDSEDDGESIADSSSTGSTTSESEDGADEDIRKFVVPDDHVSSAEDSDDEDEEVQAQRNPRIKNEVGNLDTLSSESAIKHEIEDDDNDDEEFMEVKDIKPAQKSGKRPSGGLSHDSGKRAKKHKSKSRTKDKGKARAKDKAKEPKIKHTSMAMLKKEAMRSKEGHRRYMRYLRKNWVSSAKVDKCLEILRDTEPDVKTIVFSQFTTLLDLLEIPVRKEEWGFMRYDGSMSADARHHSVVKFTDDPRCKVMLVSLKAGNAGLNLVAASQVIILDPFWNPFIEMQAVDRAHRIGQQKPVKVHRILVQNTVEDRIIDLQNRKRKLVEAALDEKASQGLGRLGRQELIYLFNGGGERETAPRPAYVPGLGSMAAAVGNAFTAARSPVDDASSSSE